MENIIPSLNKKVHFITYGDDFFKLSKERLIAQAKKFREFNTIRCYGPGDLSKDFRNKFKDILKMKRLAGYSLWRPYIIKQRLDEIEYGEFLLYLDAGFTINNYGKKRYYEYIQMIDESRYGIISFALRYLEKHWTVKEIFQHFNCENDLNIINSPQFLSGAIFMKKNDHVLRIMNRFYHTIYENPLLFTDFYNDKNQISEFRENRHEQSILSVIEKLEGSLVLENEVDFALYFKWRTLPKLFRSKQAINYPFWATRISDNRMIRVFNKTFITPRKTHYYIIRFKKKIENLWKFIIHRISSARP